MKAALFAFAVALFATVLPAEPSTLPTFKVVRMPGSTGGDEPTIAVDNSGTTYVAWQAPGHMAVSSDGVHFADRGVIDSTTLGDVTNAIGAGGAILNGQVCGDAFATHTCVYRSTDGARTWPQKTEPADMHPGASDRPWIATHGHTVFLEYHTFTPEELVYVTVSHDDGKTFSTPHVVSSDTNAIVGSGCNTMPGGAVVDQTTGAAYVVWASGNDVVANAEAGCNYATVGPFNKVWVSASTDDGATWTSHLAWQGAWNPESLVGDNAAKIFPTIVAGDGKVHVLMAVRRNDPVANFFATCEAARCDEGKTPTDLELVSSPDAGVDWTLPFVFNPSGGSNFYPWIAGGGGGVDAIYYRTRSLEPNDPSDLWQIGFSRISAIPAMRDGSAVYVDRYGNRADPTVENTLVKRGYVHKGGICTFGLFCSAVIGANRNLADAIAITIGPGGSAQAVWTNDYPDPAKKVIEYGCEVSNEAGWLHGCNDNYLVSHARRKHSGRR